VAALSSPPETPVATGPDDEAPSEATGAGLSLASLLRHSDEDALDDAELLRSLLVSKASFFESQANLLADDPDKITREPDDTNGHIWPQLLPVITGTREDLLLISPYFVPGEAGMQFLRELRARGVTITVLTNSLAATDVSVVHAGYSNYREELLRAGVELWEMKPDDAQGATHDPRDPADALWEAPPDTVRGKRSLRERLARRFKGEERPPAVITNSLRPGIHAKTFIFDRRTLFIGSMNLDPRSQSINTESGVLISNGDFADRLARNIHKLLPGSAYRLSLDEGALRWHEQMPEGTERIHNAEPESPWLRRTWVRVLRLLPFEGQL